MRIAVLADVHGNLPALEAVLAELDAEPVDAIVSAGDLAPGPLPAQCLAALRGRPEPVHWVSGNGERDIVAFLDGEADGEDPRALTRRHAAHALGAGERDVLAAWPPSLLIDGVCVCHGTPDSVDEVITRATPEARLRELLRGAAAPLVVGGHTHQQMVRALDGAPDYANAGSVGRPFEGDPAAYWMLVDSGRPEPRRTDYDVGAWVARVRASDFPTPDDCLEAAFEPLYAPAWVAAFFEHSVGRGPDPGPPVPVS